MDGNRHAKNEWKMKRGKSKKNESCIMNRGEEEMRRADEKRERTRTFLEIRDEAKGEQY